MGTIGVLELLILGVPAFLALAGLVVFLAVRGSKK
jgi:hypothetical protein